MKMSKVSAGPSPLRLTVTETPTDFWNDSCSLHELAYAISHGATGATTNPTIVYTVLKKEMAAWRGTLDDIIRSHPTWGETQVAWKIIEQMGLRGAELLAPAFVRERGLKGRLSMQTNPEFYRDAEAIVAQAEHFHRLAQNIQVKIPVTRAGVQAIEEATARGVVINATVCFTVPQAIAVAEAVERGLKRRIAQGLPTDGMAPACTIMVGRLDDWLKVQAAKRDLVMTPGILDWAGVAAIKKAYAIFRKRGYRTRLLAAAYRNHLHWSQLIGGDLILTIPYEWQVRFNASDVEVRSRIDDPVDPAFIAEMSRKLPDFDRAYNEDGMTVEDFDGFGATARTLRTFIESYHALLGLVRDVMIPNPDLG